MLHRNCTELLRNQGKVNVVQYLSTALEKQMMDHRTALKKIFSTLRILGKHGLAHNDQNSNFLRILKARAEDTAELELWLKRTSHKLLRQDILQVIATEVMQENVQEIKNVKFFFYTSG